MADKANRFKPKIICILDATIEKEVLLDADQERVKITIICKSSRWEWFTREIAQIGWEVQEIKSRKRGIEWVP